MISGIMWYSLSGPKKQVLVERKYSFIADNGDL